MATYDLTQKIPSILEKGDILNCPYSGTYKTISLPAGQYKLECWGASGGYRSSNSSYVGKGGFSKGTLTLLEDTDLYLYVGGSGNTGGSSGGWNGGGRRSSYPGGGGASDIRIGSTSLYARVIVAGGGGSEGGPSKKGGNGGGTSGQSVSSGFGTGGYGGGPTGVTDSSWQTTSQSTSTTTQEGAYAGFGFGGNGISYASGHGGAGGGGWYGGAGCYPDSSQDDDRGGGGGSGYVYTESTASNYPSECLLNSNYYLTNAETIAGNVSFLSPFKINEIGHLGDGYIRITVLNIVLKNPFVLFNGGIKLDYFKIEKEEKTKEEMIENSESLTMDTVLMNNYNESLDASYISPLNIASNSNFFIYRKTPAQSYYNYIGNLKGSSFTFSDFGINANEYYHYLATIEKKDTEGNVEYVSYENIVDGQPRYLQAKWDKFSLHDIIFDNDNQLYNVSGSTWLLYCNVESNEITQRTSVTSWDTLGQYNKVSVGQRNFDSGTLTCLLGEVKEYEIYDQNNNLTKSYDYTERIGSNYYDSEAEKEKEWKKFISNGNLKLLKDFKGNKWIIQIMQDSTRTIDYNAMKKVTMISIQWEEVDNSDKYPIIKL